MIQSVRDKIESLRSPAGAWTRASLAQLGVPWPPPRGWRQALIHGRPIPERAPKRRSSSEIPLPILPKERIDENQRITEKWDGTRIVVIDTNYPDAIARWKDQSC
jgi:hypothetical protein